MNLDFLADGADDCPLLRFYRWGDGEASLLREAAERLADGATRSIEVHRLPFVEAVGGVTFTWVAGAADSGTAQVGGGGPSPSGVAKAFGGGGLAVGVLQPSGGRARGRR